MRPRSRIALASTLSVIAAATVAFVAHAQSGGPLLRHFLSSRQERAAGRRARPPVHLGRRQVGAARYPVLIHHGHFPGSMTNDGWRETPPDADAKSTQREAQEAAYQFYKDWNGPNFPRMIHVLVQHPTPYFDDSYAVNSANNGPYGAWALCPDPIDFRSCRSLNIYDEHNAYYNAVYQTEEFFKNAKNPTADVEIVYGKRREHCFTGDSEHPNNVGSRTVHSRFSWGSNDRQNTA